MGQRRGCGMSHEHGSFVVIQVGGSQSLALGCHFQQPLGSSNSRCRWEPTACQRRLPFHQDLRLATEMAERPAALTLAAAAQAPAEAAAPFPFPRFIPGVVNMLAITFTASLLH